MGRPCSQHSSGDGLLPLLRLKGEWWNWDWLGGGSWAVKVSWTLMARNGIPHRGVVWPEAQMAVRSGKVQLAYD